MVGQTPYKQKNVSPLVTIVFTRQGNTILDKLLFPWLDFFFLDLRSEGLSSLASLGRQLSFFPTISEKKVQSRKEKFVLNCIPCLVTLCHQAGIYIPALELETSLKSRLIENNEPCKGLSHFTKTCTYRWSSINKKNWTKFWHSFAHAVTRTCVSRVRSPMLFHWAIDACLKKLLQLVDSKYVLLYCMHWHWYLGIHWWY